MTNRQLEFILQLRDNASAKWEAFRTKVSSGAGALKGIMGSLGGLMAGFATAAFFEKSIEASNEQEKAISNLNATLRAAGIYYDDLSQQMIDFGTEMQKTTKFGDEAVINAEALLVTYTGVAGAGLEPLIRAVADYAVAMDMSIDEAAKMAGRSIQSGTAMRGMAMEYTKGSTALQRVAELQEFLNKRFGGFAENEGKTAAGTIEKMNNAWGDFMEVVGDRLKEIVVAIAPLLKWLVDALTATVYYIAVGVAQLLNLLASIGGHISWLLDKVGLSTKEKTDWYKAQAQAAANASADFLHKGNAIWEEAAARTTPKITAIGDAADETGKKGAAAADRIKEHWDKLKLREPVYLNDEQEARYNRMVEQADRMRRILEMSASARHELVMEQINFDLTNPKTLPTVKGPDVVDSSAFTQLTEFEQRYLETTDVVTQAQRSVWDSFDGLVGNMVSAWMDGTQSMEDIFKSFVKGVIADLATIAIRAFLVKGITALASGGIGGFLGKSSAGSLGPSLAGATSSGGSASYNITVHAMDASSFRQFLGQSENRGAVVSAIRDAFAKEKYR